MAERNNIEFAWLALIAAAAVTVGAFLPPILSETAAARVMIAYSFVCHQLPDRSPSINGVPIAICYRCTGIYFGLVAGLYFARATIELRLNRLGLDQVQGE